MSYSSPPRVPCVGDTGTVLELTKGANGYTEQVLFTFAAGSNINATGAQPIAGLIADAAGNLFGTAGAGGSHGSGVVYELTDTGFAVACYCAGTRIRIVLNDTEADVAVGALRIGDFVVTASSAHRAIRWLGKRSYSGRFANRNPDTLPVCFKAGSLDDNVPARDLWVSRKHAMFINGVLVPAEHLVNGVSIVKATRVDHVDYYHVELDSHDVLLAGGRPAKASLTTTAG